MIAGLDLSKGKGAEWIFRLLMVVGVLYLSANYVSIEAYKTDMAKMVAEEKAKTDSLTDIKLILARMEERLKYDDSRPRIEKLEERVNAVEKLIPKP